LAGTCINNLELQVFKYFLLFLIWVVGVANAMSPGIAADGPGGIQIVGKISFLKTIRIQHS
jgi:hypothetical protein